ncbi:MAG TPA: glycosyltransferase family 1 protein [Dictyobacter sp.]|jgi:glycosyltransferase involved in cell wall biosynthesis|nr:glycosyltransferase family 1 protein [Dictyobacter sp.]
MRVAIITENFLPKLDGVTRTLARLLEHLQASGHQVLLLGPESGMQQYAGAEIIGTAGLPLPFYPELKFNFFRPLFLRRLSEFRPDILHIVDPVVLGTTGLAAARLLNIPIVSSYHTNLAEYCDYFGFPFLVKPMWAYNRFIHNQCALTFCPSISTQKALTTRGFTQVRLWSRGVDTQLFQPAKRNEQLRQNWLQSSETSVGKKILLYVGRVSWEKNLRLLVDAYKHMDHQTCHLVIVGHGPAYAEVQHDLKDVPVTFTGYLRGDALAQAYASADIFVFPSQSETFGQVVLEAMASGLPVVGIQSEGVGDLVQDGVSGLLLSNDEHERASQAEAYHLLIQQLVQHDDQRLNMGDAACAHATTYSWHEAMASLVSGYEEVIQSGQSLLAA